MTGRRLSKLLLWACDDKSKVSQRKQLKGTIFFFTHSDHEYRKADYMRENE